MSVDSVSRTSVPRIWSADTDATEAALRQQFREVMAGVATPVAIVTTVDNDRPHGATVSAFVSLSMEPPLLLISLDKRSELLKLIQVSHRFGLNVLGSGQHELAASFARKNVVDKFDGVQWQPCHGVPRLPDVCGWVACDVSEFVDAGDHTMVIGTVVEAEHDISAPLTYHRRAFGTHVGIGTLA